MKKLIAAVIVLNLVYFLVQKTSLFNKLSQENLTAESRLIQTLHPVFEKTKSRQPGCSVYIFVSPSGSCSCLDQLKELYKHYLSNPGMYYLNVICLGENNACTLVKELVPGVDALYSLKSQNPFELLNIDKTGTVKLIFSPAGKLTYVSVDDRSTREKVNIYNVLEQF